MNPDLPRSAREEFEIKITALLMGQLPPAEAAEVQAQIAADPELAALHARLSHAAQLLRESRALPDAATLAVPLQLAKEKREKLLAAFRAAKPQPDQVTAAPPAVSSARQSSRWKGRLALAASIAVLLGGAVYIFRGATYMRSAREMVAMSAPASAPANQWYEGRRFAAAPDMAADALPQTNDYSKALAGAQGRPKDAGVVDESVRWLSQPGVARTFRDENETNTSHYYHYSKDGTQPPAPASAPISGSGQTVPRVLSLASVERAKQPAGGAGIYLPPTNAPAAPEPPSTPRSVAVEDQVSFSTSTLATIVPPIATANKPASASSPATPPTDEKGSKSNITTGNLNFGGIAANRETAQRPGERFGVVQRELARRATREDASAAKESEAIQQSQDARTGIAANAIDSLLFSEVPASPPVSNPEPAAPKEVKQEITSSFTGQGANDNLITQLDTDAKHYAELGRYEMAGRKYEEILNKDPNNIAARKGREEMHTRKAQVADAGYSAARSQAMWEVTSNWARPYRRFDRRAVEIRGTSADGEKQKDEPTLEQLQDLPVPLRYTEQLGDTTKLAKSDGWKFNAKTAGENTYWDDAERASAMEQSKSGREIRLTGLADGKPADGAVTNGTQPISEGKDGRAKNTELFFSGGTAGATPARDVADFDRGISKHIDGPIINKLDEGGVRFEFIDESADSLAKLTAPLGPEAKAKAPEQPATASKPASITSSFTPAQGVEPAQEAFVSSFLRVRKAEEQAAAGETQKALENYRAAADTLQKIKEQWPNWQPELLGYRLNRTAKALEDVEAKLGEKSGDTAGKKVEPAEAKPVAEPAPAAATPAEPPAPVKAPEPPPVPQPEVSTKENAFSTFSLNVSDVSFQLAAASLDKGQMPEPASVRSEEFINALNYRDPEPAAGTPLAFASERARYPFAHNRDLLRISVKTAAAGRESGRPLNLVLLLDNSGSMERADRVRILQESLRVLTQQLQPQDKLSIITFSRNARLWADGVSAEKAAEFAQRVSEITPQGGTDLSAAMDLGYKTALKHYQPAAVNRVVLLTDGAANLGDVKPETLKERVEAHRKQGIAFDCFGVGWEGYNDDLLEQLSRNGDGRYGFINTPEAAATEFAGKLAGALRVAASDVKVQVEFNPRRVLAYRQIGYAKHQLKKEQFRDNTVDAAEIGAAESGNALYTVEVNPRGEGDIAIVRARFKTPGTTDYHEHEWTVPFQAPAPAMEQASSSLRLAGSAAAFSEWLAQSPFAAEVTTDRLLGLTSGLPAIYGADPRPAKLEAMIRQAKSISGR